MSANKAINIGEEIKQRNKLIEEAILTKNDLYYQLIKEGRLKKIENSSSTNRRAKKNFKKEEFKWE